MHDWWHRLWAWIDRVLDAIEGFDFNIHSYFAIFLLGPLLAVVIISLFLFDLRPYIRPYIDQIFLGIVLGYPIWAIVSVYMSRKRQTQLSTWRDRVERVVIFIGSILILFGAYVWIVGISK